MLLKQLGRTSAPAASLQGRNVVVPHVRPLARRHAAFKGSRRSVQAFAAAEGAAPAKVQLETLKEGDELEGTVVSIETFGAFVDVGAASPGLVHISKLASGFVKNVKDVVSQGQKVTVTVLSTDAAKGRLSLSLKTAAAAAEAPAPAAAEETSLELATDSAPEGADQQDDDEDVGVELEDGQLEVYADLAGYDDIPFVMEEEDVDELTEPAMAAMEQDLDAVQVEYELDAPPYMAEVSGKVTRIEEYGLFVDFEWNGKTLSGLLPREELKVPTAKVSEETKAELRAAWAATPFELPAFTEPPEGDAFSIGKYYAVGDAVSALVLESGLVEARGISLTHFTDEDVAAEAVEAFEALEDDEDEELDGLLEEAAELEDEVLAFDPEDLLEEADSEADAPARADVPVARDGEDAGYINFSSEAQDYSEDLFGSGAFRSYLKDKKGNSVAPMGFPNRPLAEPLRGDSLAPLRMSETDFTGDEVQLYDFWNSDLVDNMPKDILKRMGVKMSVDAQGEAEFTEIEGHEEQQLPLVFLPGRAVSIEDEARAIVEDLLDDDVDEAEMPARAARRPIVLATAVQNISAAAVKALREKTGAGMMDCKKALAECDCNEEAAVEWLRKKGLAGADKKAGRLAAEGAIARYIHPGSRLGVLLEVNCETDFVAASEKFQKLVGELGMIIASTDCICVSPEDVPPEVLAKEREIEMGKEDLANKPEAIRAKIVEGRLEKMKTQMALLNQQTLSDPNKTVSDLVKETIAAVGENIKIRRFVKYRLGEGLEKRSTDFAAEVAQQTQAKAAAPKPTEEPKKEEAKKEEAKPAVQVSATVVKELRDKTGAGMMDCKKALAENGNDMDKAVEWLRVKGLASADKKAGRLAAEGVVASYIHPGSRLGVLLEVNCETDFVAASEKFNELVGYIAMGIAAAQNVQYVSADDIPADVFEREKQIEMARDDLKSKPEAIRAKIAEGRVKKMAQEMAVLEQPYLVDNSKTVAEAIKEAIAAIGEKVSVRRFVKFSLGEGLEKKSTDFAAEVAAVTGQK